MGATLVSSRLAATIHIEEHGSTFGGGPLACAAADATLRVVEEEKLVARAAELGGRLHARLRAFASERPDRALAARGRGLLQALLLRDADQAAALPLRAIERGVLVNVTAGNVVRFFPALNIPEDELFTGVDRLLELIAG
jgi:acetylornithine/succinyldiaminopimelate/putrescine aminotransferase